MTDIEPKRQQHYKEKIESMMRTDFEMLNTVLSIEINTQMNPEVIRSVLRQVIARLTPTERRALPQMVVEILTALDGDYVSKEFSKYLKKPKAQQDAGFEPERPLA